MSLRALKITASTTRRDEVGLRKYLGEISKISLISPEEEIALAVRIKLGDEKAIEKLTKANLRFVISVAKQFQNNGISLSDLINEGNIGLIKAAQKFDETKGFKFISYAVWWIRQSILQAIAEQSKMVRLPVNKFGSDNRVYKASQRLEQELEREPSAEEIAEYIQMDVNEVTLSITRQSRNVSMDSPIGSSEETTLLDVMEDTNTAKTDFNVDYKQSLHFELQRSLKTLSNVQQFILCQHYGIGVDRPLTLDEIAEKLNLSRERIRQIKDKALVILQNIHSSNSLRSFLG